MWNMKKMKRAGKIELVDCCNRRSLGHSDCFAMSLFAIKLWRSKKWAGQRDMRLKIKENSCVDVAAHFVSEMNVVTICGLTKTDVKPQIWNENCGCKKIVTEAHMTSCLKHASDSRHHEKRPSVHKCYVTRRHESYANHGEHWQCIVRM